MFSFALARAGRHASALALISLFAIAPARAQQSPGAARDTTKSTMPAGMQMGAPAKKKKPAAASKPKASAAKKKASIGAASKSRPSAKKKTSTMPGMKMGAHSTGAAADTARGKAGAMDMQHVPAVGKDSAPMNMPNMSNMPANPDSAHMNMPGMAGMPGMHGHTTEDMMIGPAGVSMERMGSGTTWIPDAVTMPNRRRMLGDWMIMSHGFAFLQYDKQSGERGDDQFGSLNWTMLMATHDFAGGRFQARTMLSLDPLTVTNRGYPLLLQSGETYKGQPLHDRQHPHDFWMELGALYQRPITKSLAWSIYAAPSGEPALSPVAFMHRPSGMDNLTAPIGHHWQDATHVSFGVLTGGIFTHTWQLEGSIFNGREPDENRWNFDPIKLDSYSARFTVNPNVHWSLQGLSLIHIDAADE
jgi:hypothetical protein